MREMLIATGLVFFIALGINLVNRTMVAQNIKRAMPPLIDSHDAKWKRLPFFEGEIEDRRPKQDINRTSRGDKW